MYLPVSTRSGSVGLLADLDPTQLPSDGWSAGNNVRFLNGKLLKSPGPVQIFSTCPIVPYQTFPVQVENNIYWVAMGLQHAYVWTGTAWVKITRYLASFAWAALYTADIGYKIKDPNGYCQQVTTIQAMPVWAHGSPALGYQIEDNKGNCQRVTTAGGVNGATAPAWASTVGTTTTDGAVVWTCEGLASAPGQTGAVIPLAFATGMSATTVDGGVTWTNEGPASVDNVYTGAATDRWSGEFFNGLLVVSNNVDPPQCWDCATGDRFTDLEYWPVGNTAGILRSFNSFLIALGGTSIYQLSWSAPADPGTVPDSWDAADPTTQAGNIPFAQTGGEFIDGATLGNNFIVYKSDSVYALQFVGGTLVFGEVPIFTDIGLLALGCVVAFNNMHFVVTPNDVVTHNGVNWQSIINQENRNLLFSQLDPNQIGQTFCVHNERLAEIWICYASIGSSYPDSALIYNYQQETWSVIDLPNVTDAKFFVVNPPTTDDTFYGAPDATQPFNTDFNQFYEGYTELTNQWVVSCSPVNSFFYQHDQIETNNGTPFYAYVERTGLDFGTPEMTKRISPYYENVQQQGPEIVMITKVFPKLRASGPVQIQIGAQARSLADPVAWTSPYIYDPATMSMIPTLVTGRLIGFRVSSNANVHWELEGYGMEFESVGNF